MSTRTLNILQIVAILLSALLGYVIGIQNHANPLQYMVLGAGTALIISAFFVRFMPSRQQKLRMLLAEILSLSQPYEMPRKIELLRKALPLVENSEGRNEIWAELQFSLGNTLEKISPGDPTQNLDRAIVAYEESLAVLSRAGASQESGNVQYHLGLAYLRRSHGIRSADLERAIRAFEAVLPNNPRSVFPEKWADIMNSLGKAYLLRINDDYNTNLQRAIEYCEAALQVFSRTTHPQEWAQAQLTLGSGYSALHIPNNSALHIPNNSAGNQERAIIALEAALTILTPTTLPEDWASAQVNLGNMYRYRITGDPDQNIEHAITCYQTALRVVTRTSLPERWAMIQSHLVSAYTKRVQGSSTENLAKAVEAGEAAMSIRTLHDYPLEWADTQANLGHVYFSLQGDNPVGLERAIQYYEAALERYTLSGEASEWAAEALTNLGHAYMRRGQGVRKENIEHAIASYEDALRVFTRLDFLDRWALIQNNLGNAYMDRVEGDHSNNIERAIVYCKADLAIQKETGTPYRRAQSYSNLGKAYIDRVAGNRFKNLESAMEYCETALQVFTLTDYPLDWAMTKNNLGIVYRNRRAGDPSKNLEHAITCFNDALRVYTHMDYPLEWAMTMNNLGNVYRFRIVGVRADNLELALTCYQAILNVYTEATFPAYWARTQRNLGLVYTDRLREDRTRNLDLAIACLEAALSVRTPIEYPIEYRLTASTLAHIEAERKNWEKAHLVYTQAIEAEDLLLVFGAGMHGRDAILKGGEGSVTARNGFVLAQLGRLAEAAVSIEHGRARGLAEAHALDIANPDLIQDLQLRQRYIEARDALTITQAALNQPLPDDMLREQKLEMYEAYRQSKQQFDDLVAEISRDQDLVGFLQDDLDPAMILRAAERGGVGHALVYLLATPWGGLALAVSGAIQERFAALPLPDLTEAFESNLVTTRMGGYICGGYGEAQQGSPASAVVGQWPGETFAEKGAHLHAACEGSTLDSAMQEILQLFRLQGIINKPLAQLTEEKIVEIEVRVSDALLRRELLRCLPLISSVALHPLVAWLHKSGILSVTLIPCGALAAFPLPAAPINNAKTASEWKIFGDSMPTSIAPSARSLLASAPPVRVAHARQPAVYTLGNPSSAFPLKWAEAEAETLARIARELGMIGKFVRWSSATRAWLIQALGEALVVSSSSHGIFVTENYLQSYLLLADGEGLTLYDVLRSDKKVDMHGLRLLILSACQTAIPDLQNAPDEVHSFAAGALQAGAEAVLAALWPVDDKATYLLIARFAQEWFPDMKHEPPAAAFARAQQWLRSATTRQLQEWHPTMFPAGKRSTNACPYADPIYWAGFQITGW